MTHTFDEIIRLDSERTQGRWSSYTTGDIWAEDLNESVYTECSAPNGISDANGAYIAAMPDAVGLLKLYKQLLDRAIMGLEGIAEPRYPETIFTPLTPDDWEAIKDCCHGRGFVLDRLSGEYGRIFTKVLNAIATETLADVRKQLDGDGNGG